MIKKTLCIASLNKNKIEEMAPMLSAMWEVKSTPDYPGVEEVDETGDSFLATPH